jgi:hypothetical protein
LGSLRAFFAARAHMWGVVAIEHLLLCSHSNKAGVGAQMLAGTRRHRRSRYNQGVQGDAQLAHVVPISPGHDDR